MLPKVQSMKILTLNCHSLLEEDYPQKRKQFVDYVIRENVDLIALQEVNQTIGAAQIDPAMLEGFVPVPGMEKNMLEDNHAAHVAKLLRDAGLCVSWTWLPVKVSYDRYDEGLAMMRIGGAIREIDSIHLTRSADYSDWRVRKALGVRIGGDWFYTVHLGWWDDVQEPFLHQWNRLNESVRRDGAVWLMGDFTSPAEVRGEGYDQIRADGWHDAWLMAEQRRGEATVEGVIDGWRSRAENPETLTGMRIDHIWCSRPASVASAKVIFDGKHEPKVSDHFGILLETKGENS